MKHSKSRQRRGYVSSDMRDRILAATIVVAFIFIVIVLQSLYPVPL
jgi:hypothetical protein